MNSWKRPVYWLWYTERYKGRFILPPFPTADDCSSSSKFGGKRNPLYRPQSSPTSFCRMPATKVSKTLSQHHSLSLLFAVRTPLNHIIKFVARIANLCCIDFLLVISSWPSTVHWTERPERTSTNLMPRPRYAYCSQPITALAHRRTRVYSSPSTTCWTSQGWKVARIHPSASHSTYIARSRKRPTFTVTRHAEGTCDLYSRFRGRAWLWGIPGRFEPW